MSNVLVNGRPYQLPDHPNFKSYRGQSNPTVHVGLINTGSSLCGRAIPETTKTPTSKDRLCRSCQDGLRRMGLLAGRIEQ